MKTILLIMAAGIGSRFEMKGTFRVRPNERYTGTLMDIPPVKERISLQRHCSNNFIQVAVHAHIYGVYLEEIDGLKRDYEKLWGEVSKVLRELSKLVAK